METYRVRVLSLLVGLAQFVSLGRVELLSANVDPEFYPSMTRSLVRLSVPLPRPSLRFSCVVTYSTPSKRLFLYTRFPYAEAWLDSFTLDHFDP